MKHRISENIKTCIPRLLELVPQVECEQRSRGATWQLSIPSSEAFRGLEYDRFRAFARVTIYALESGYTAEEIREHVRWKAPDRRDMPDNHYELRVNKLLDKLGGSDTRLLLRTYQGLDR